MISYLPLLQTLLPPPTEARPPVGNSINRRHGLPLPLPQDYLTFLHVYGAGDILNPRYLWSVLDLTLDAEVFRASQIIGAGEDRYLDLRGQKVLAYPYGMDIVPWGCDDQGDTFYWVTDGEPDEWTVVVGRFELFETNVSFVQFLYDSITGKANYVGHPEPAWDPPIRYSAYAEWDRAESRKDRRSSIHGNCYPIFINPVLRAN
jgi:hypothetical protein